MIEYILLSNILFLTPFIIRISSSVYFSELLNLNLLDPLFRTNLYSAPLGSGRAYSISTFGIEPGSPIFVPAAQVKKLGSILPDNSIVAPHILPARTASFNSNKLFRSHVTRP